MTYKNRKRQLLQTLRSITASKPSAEFEVVIVDDASDSEHRIEDFKNEFPFMRLIRIEPEQKKWKNPCVPYNMAFRAARGDIIIIQNAECAHVGNILDYVKEYIKDNEYMTFSCLSFPHILTEKYCVEDYFGKGDLTEAKNIASGMGQPAQFDGDFGWYNHPQFLPRGLHFCNAITTKDLYRVGGFDERFSDGLCYDDNEFIWRLSNLKFNLKFIKDPFVIHLFHYADCSIEMDPNKQALLDYNANIFNLLQSQVLPLWSRALTRDESI